MSYFVLQWTLLVGNLPATNDMYALGGWWVWLVQQQQLAPFAVEAHRDKYSLVIRQTDRQLACITTRFYVRNIYSLIVRITRYIPRN